MTNQHADAIEAALEPLGTVERAVNEKRYLKSELTHFGVKVPIIRKTTKELVRGLDLPASRAVAVALWDRPIHECRTAAVEVLMVVRKKLELSDVQMLEAMLRAAKTWALLDAIATGLVGTILENHPALEATLDRWAKDDDFWIRRSAMLALLPGLRCGEGDFERFSRYADAMLDEKEFFIRKAIGWILREASKKRPDLVDAFIAPRTHRASGVTMREAVKKLTPKRQNELMVAYRAGVAALK